MRIRIFVGTGGVGKTSLTAATGLQTALDGGKCLVLTIDPAWRLRTALNLTSSDLQQKVDLAGLPAKGELWAALLDVPYGETASYGELAQHVGRPGAARAVGLANAHNPLAIVVPCHRVVGASGSLTGYAGGLHRKRWLLAHEARHAA